MSENPEKKPKKKPEPFDMKKFEELEAEFKAAVKAFEGKIAHKTEQIEEKKKDIAHELEQIAGMILQLYIIEFVTHLSVLYQDSELSDEIFKRRVQLDKEIAILFQARQAERARKEKKEKK